MPLQKKWLIWDNELGAHMRSTLCIQTYLKVMPYVEEKSQETKYIEYLIVIAFPVCHISKWINHFHVTYLAK